MGWHRLTQPRTPQVLGSNPRGRTTVQRLARAPAPHAGPLPGRITHAPDRSRDGSLPVTARPREVARPSVARPSTARHVRDRAHGRARRALPGRCRHLPRRAVDAPPGHVGSPDGAWGPPTGRELRPAARLRPGGRPVPLRTSRCPSSSRRTEGSCRSRCTRPRWTRYPTASGWRSTPWG